MEFSSNFLGRFASQDSPNGDDKLLNGKACVKPIASSRAFQDHKRIMLEGNIRSFWGSR